MTMAAPTNVSAPGTVFHSSQSSSTPQIIAVYSNGATTLASPCRNASVMAHCAIDPTMAIAPITGQCSARMVRHTGAAIAPAMTAMSSMFQNMMLCVVSVRPRILTLMLLNA